MTITVTSNIGMLAPAFLAISLVIAFCIYKKGYSDYASLVLFVLMYAGKLLVVYDTQILLYWNVLIWLSIAFLVTQVPTFFKRVFN